MSTKPLLLSAEPTRRRLTERQARTVQRLTRATLVELRKHDYAGLTVRNVARRAGIAAATAYNYFTSKDHLVCETFWRLLQEVPEPAFGASEARSARAVHVLSDVARILADEPELAAACTTAMLASTPEVQELRELIGAEIRRRLVVALGRDADPRLFETLEMVLSGAMVRAGTGHCRFDELPALLGQAGEVVFGGER